MEADLIKLFEASSAVIMVSGRRGFGKTNIALRILEDALDEKLISQIATNVICKDERVCEITTFPDLEDYLQTKGRKGFILDEAGKIISRMRFMSKLNVRIMNVIQLIRHFKGYFIAIAPSEKFIDSNFLNTDILDCRIKKTGIKFAEVKNYLTWSAYTLDNVSETSIKYSQHPAEFSMNRKVETDKLPAQAQAAYYYGLHGSFDLAGQQFNPPIHREQIKRDVIAYLRKAFEK